MEKTEISKKSFNIHLTNANYWGKIKAHQKSGRIGKMTKMLRNAVKNSVSCPARSRNAASSVCFFAVRFFSYCFYYFYFYGKTKPQQTLLNATV